MSDNNYTCRDTYYNYGSYLRSRGFDKEVCNLFAELGKGNTNIGPIDPGSCSSGDPTTINNNVVINPCENDIVNSTGTLLITGGDSTTPSIQAMNGGHFEGDVMITGNLSVSGYLEDVSSVSVYESLEIDTYKGYIGDSFSIYQSPGTQVNPTKGNIQTMWTDSSANTSGINAWKKYLVFGIDGHDGADGATTQPGHTRMLRGATLCNPPLGPIGITIPTVDSSVALDVFGGLYVHEGNDGAHSVIDISGGDFFISNGADENIHFDSMGEGFMAGMLEVSDISVNDLSVNTFAFIQDLSANDISVDNIDIYSLLTVSDLSVNTFAFIQDLSANDISVNNIDIYSLLTVSDLSVNDLSVNTFAFIQDLSANDISVNNLHVHNDIIFNKNPLVDRAPNETYINFGTAKAVIKMKPGFPTLDNSNTSTFLNCPPNTTTYYSNYPSGTFSTGTGPAIITNTDFFKNSIMEFSVSLDCSFNSISSGLRCVLENGANQLKIDARSISGLTYEKLVFGPVSYYTDSYYSDIDIANNLKVKLERMGPVGDVYDISNVRLTMTTTNIEN